MEISNKFQSSMWLDNSCDKSFLSKVGVHDEEDDEEEDEDEEDDDEEVEFDDEELEEESEEEFKEEFEERVAEADDGGADDDEEMDGVSVSKSSTAASSAAVLVQLSLAVEVETAAAAAATSINGLSPSCFLSCCLDDVLIDVSCISLIKLASSTAAEAASSTCPDLNLIGFPPLR